MQHTDQTRPDGHRRQLLANLRAEFADETRVLGDACLASVKGALDTLGGATATVDDAGERYRVQLMPSLRDVTMLQATCRCVSSGDPPCLHVWTVLRAIDLRDLWPRGLAMPTAIDITDPSDPDLDLIADTGVVIRGMPMMTAPRPVPVPVASSALLETYTRALAPRSWRELVQTWPTARPPAAGKIVAVEYILQTTSVATGDDTVGTVDDRACAVAVTAVPRGKGLATRRYTAVDPGKLSGDDLAIQALLFGVEELVDLGRSSSAPRFQVANRGKRLAARIDATRTGEILTRLADTGRFGWLPDALGKLAPLAWDAAGPWALEIAIAPGVTRAQVVVTGSLVRGEDRMALAEIVAVAGGGVAIAGHRAVQVSVDGLARWLQLFRHDVSLAGSEVPVFVERTCNARRPPLLVLGDVGIEIAEREPTARIVIEPHGRSGFTARAELAYDDQLIEVTMPATIVRARGKRLVRRRLDDEARLALAIRTLGGSFERPWSVAPCKFRELVEAGTAQGIEVFYAGGRLRSGGSFAAVVESGVDWFDLSIAVDVPGAELAMPELLSALRTGRPLIKLSDGSTVLIPTWLERRAAALTAAPLAGDALRFRKSEALLLAALLEGAPDVDVDATFAKLRDRLDQFAGLTPRDAPRGFAATLRDYQRDGVGWLHFLRDLGLGGCLADDMGLGKTIQVLALLEHDRTTARRRRGWTTHKPSLVVAPKSLVFHWLDEAKRFAPRLATLEWHGLDRAQRADELAKADLIVTTYATLRLDLERLGAIDYAIVILDEAHAIKTAATATAQAARALRGDFRLALTGTPVENRLDDLASIFDFVNPGLLGRPAALRALADVGVPSTDARAVELSQARSLGRVLRPFMLRRTKDQVLTELPPKTELVVTCRLDGVERRRYDELRAHYRNALLPAIERDGVGRSAILVLEALLRLRQAALHPGLLDAARAGEDSAKLDALVEHLREAIASGHRALVFSQFTTLLGIVRARLEREGIAVQYLDGKTVDRRERVAAFQAGDASVFLLSLKAGGTGLNLTAADHVFLLDPWWNPAVEAQAIDRVHRIGQGRPVTAYRLIAEDTVESKIVALQSHKRAVFDSVFEDTGMVANLSVSDLRALLE